MRSPSQIYVFGKTAGTTTVYATDAGGHVVYSATVRVGQNLGSVGQMLSIAMPEANITATPMNGMVLLTGTVAQPDDAAEAERLVQAFVGETTQVVSRLRTATPQQVMLQVRIAEVNRTLVARHRHQSLLQPRHRPAASSPASAAARPARSPRHQHGGSARGLPRRRDHFQ